ncbi:MAG: bifunctional phosphopantothenoylcysteine decarboxylase/phosphopantothenate--cysteine ligase CoaBC, partial [Campylobacterota bacterium]|nr:bifunctional phosphopantothenoylcysteine decarboxylase/phosphopantothenate--cysteine ligase CoaBC [Campylobacterota bacterium]
LGVTGSIAVYKSLELTRLFIKAGAEVKIIMSDSAKKFVTPLTFETLTSNRVLDDTNESWTDNHNHIKIGEWADIFVVAPATANTISKLSNAIADNILLQSALAFSSEKVIAPSANTNMLFNPIVQENLKKLQSSNYTLVGTQVKELACKTTGDGAMAEPLDIFWTTTRQLLKDEFWSNRSVIVTGGGTIEKIDDVRYLSNFSSGKMASSLALALYCRGAQVELIATRFEPNLPSLLSVTKVEETLEISSAIKRAREAFSQEKKPYLFMAAAVSDFVPKNIQDGKLKKETLGDNWSLELTKNMDILKSIDKNGITVIGFKAEMDRASATTNATNMLTNKNLDAVCLNVLKDSSSFGSDVNTIDFITHKGTNSLKTSDKLSLSFQIIKNAKNIKE